MAYKYLNATVALPKPAVDAYLREDFERTGNLTEVETSRLHDAHGRADPDACVIGGAPQAVMFAIGILAANGEDCLLRVESPAR